MSTGPDVVAVGGGRGLSVTLAAARRYAAHTTGVVATADDSGSTGRLRASMSIPAPGDLRRCLTAIAGLEDGPLGHALEHRFAGTDVEGHTLGNLLLAGLTAVTGDFLTAVDEVSRLLEIDPASGRVVPATLDPVMLWATTRDGGVVRGQYAVSQTEAIDTVALMPDGVTAPAGIADAVRQADQVILGPGSVYTSVLAAALVADLRAAIAETAARRIYVCNLVPEPAETLGYDVAAHVAALRAHGVHPDAVLVHDGDNLPLGDLSGVDVIAADLSRAGTPAHDPAKLAAALSGIAA
jgi:uncharacterized cofD-like protein